MGDWCVYLGLGGELSAGVAVSDDVGVQRAVASLDSPRPMLCRWRMRLVETYALHIHIYAVLTNRIMARNIK